MIDAEGAVFCGVLDGVGQIQITELLDEDRELPVTLTLVAGLIKGERWDWLLQKCTELGVSPDCSVSIQPHGREVGTG